MQKEWTAFRITLLLYVAVLVLPISFYFVFDAFDTMQNDTKAMQRIGQIGNTIERLASLEKGEKNRAIFNQVDTELTELQTWFSQKDIDRVTAGGRTLSNDFIQLQSCWMAFRKGYLQQQDEAVLSKSRQLCRSKINLLTFIVEKMLDVKQDRMMNILYGTFLITMLITVLLIYFVREYIAIQIKKHAIHDLETNLFNKNYFLSQLNTTCARTDRHGYPLSMIAVKIEAFETMAKTVDKKRQKHFLEMFGGLILSLTRTSDVACRYSDDTFFIILPDTNKDNAGIVEGRIQETLDAHDFMIEETVKFDVAVAEYQQKEQVDKFIERTQNTLS